MVFSESKVSDIFFTGKRQFWSVKKNRNLIKEGGAGSELFFGTNLLNEYQTN